MCADETYARPTALCAPLGSSILHSLDAKLAAILCADSAGADEWAVDLRALCAAPTLDRTSVLGCLRASGCAPPSPSAPPAGLLLALALLGLGQPTAAACEADLCALLDEGEWEEEEYSHFTRALARSLAGGAPALRTLTLRGGVELPVHALRGGGGGGAPHHLDLFRAALCDGEGQLVASLLAQGALPQLHTLELGGNALSDGAAHSLAAAIGKAGAPRLHSLLLGRNRVHAAGVVALAEALACHAPALRELGLSCNPIGDAGCRALVGVCGLCGLHRLFLSRCGIGDEGALAIANALCSGSMRELQQLWLAANRIGPGGARALTEAAVAGVRGGHPFPPPEGTKELQLDLHDNVA
ncbi:hypothetical protein AB1Y20_010591 [Prymnesium parvum]|uniref:Distal membrane arm assembly complex 2-like protein n=1 Tax=Prymnesium parvum TaxID=97485 RepID=A0AB34IRX5_PRYPA